MTSVVEHEPQPSELEEVKPVWPRDLPLTALSDGIEAPYGVLGGELEPGGQLMLDAAGESILIGVQESATTLRLIPTPGPTPLLVFTQPRLRCAPGRSLNVEIDVSLHLTLGVGGPRTPYTTVHEIEPPGARRALYGPVDAGIICRSVYTRAATSLDTRDPAELTARLKLSVVNTSSVTLEVSKVMLPVDSLSLWQHPTSGIFAGTTHMKLLSVREAELRFSQDHPDGCVPILGMNGERTDDSRPPLLFTYAYKNKTGLEYGF